MKRILVIEDDTLQRRLFKIGLEDLGYEILEASDGQAGLQLFLQKPCDLVITDIFMPEKEGLETIMDLKSMFSDVKIIAISGGGSRSQYGESVRLDNVLEAAKEFGADYTLKKPIKIPHLLEIVKGMLNSNNQKHE